MCSCFRWQLFNFTILVDFYLLIYSVLLYSLIAMSAYDTIASNALHKLFGYSEFKSRLQKKAIIEILSSKYTFIFQWSECLLRVSANWYSMGIPFSVYVSFWIYVEKRDVFLNMPTGSGKSLCYQLPGAVATDQVMVVVSPLLSLIEDQINHLAKYNLCAVTLNSQMSNEVKKELYKRLTLTNDEKSKAKRTKKPIQFLYVTPEQAASKKFLAMMHYMVEQKRISYIVVDEAHCVSEWGHDFRPDYASLGNLRKAFKKITWVACTATASDEVRESIIKQLQLQEPVCQIISNSFRNNLYYEVLFTNILENAFEDLVRYIRNHLKNKNINISHTNTSGQKTLKGQPSESQSNAKKCVSGIIYCNYQNTVDSLSESLNERDIPAMPYHGGLDKAKRQKVQELWCSNQVPVIVATKAFGMGVDKAEVRFVVHWNTPQNISAYYQETGRAGRDGEKAFCRLYFDDDDVNRIRFTLQQDFNRAVSSLTRNEKALALKRKAVAEFDLFIKYCENGSQCRHELFAKYFHEPKPNCKAQCDVCKDRSMVRANINRHNEVKGASRAKTTIQRISYPRNRGILKSFYFFLLICFRQILGAACGGDN